MTVALFNHRALAALLFVAAAALAAGVILWALLDEERPLTADEMVEHICTGGVTYPNFYDISTAITATQGVLVPHQTREYRKAPGAAHFLDSDAEGTERTELIFLLLPASAAASADPASDDSGESTEEHFFMRRTDSSGQWEEWVAGPKEPRGTRSLPEAEQDIYRFCRSLPEVLGEMVEFQYVGEEVVGGVDTMHFYQSHRQPGYVGYRAREFWVDSEGLFRQVKETFYGEFNRDGELESYYEALKTYSGWGETNVITAPESAAPWPISPTPTR